MNQKEKQESFKSINESRIYTLEDYLLSYIQEDQTAANDPRKCLVTVYKKDTMNQRSLLIRDATLKAVLDNCTFSLKLPVIASTTTSTKEIENTYYPTFKSNVNNSKREIAIEILDFKLEKEYWFFMTVFGADHGYVKMTYQEALAVYKAVHADWYKDPIHEDSPTNMHGFNINLMKFIED